jgi:hypothetical protein
MSRRQNICLGYGIWLGSLFAFYWIASYGNIPDASPFRGILNPVFLYIFPISVAAFVMHLAFTFCSRSQLAPVIVGAFVSGFSGPFLVYWEIGTTTDPEAPPLLHLLLPMAYCMGVAVFGITAIVTLKIYECYRRCMAKH